MESETRHAEHPLSRVARDDLAWKAVSAQIDAVHAKIKALLAMPPGSADVSIQLQNARADLRDAEQALKTFIALRMNRATDEGLRPGM